MPWVGGKKALRDEILLRFPLAYERYIEVFGGGGWVLFHKPAGDFEVYNDFNANLVTLYRCVRNQPEELIAKLEFTLNSRDDFEQIRSILRSKVELSDMQRAAYFYQLIRQSYAAGLDSYGAQPRDMWSRFPLIRAASARLQGVIIENRDFEKLISQYDRPESLFYCDPPYFFTENYYEDVGFTAADHGRLAGALFGLKGKWLLSYNDCAQVRELYNRPGIMIEPISRLSNIAQRYEGGKLYEEVIISNYDTTERARQHVQLSLFDSDFCAGEPP
ncbi:MAG: DNA adenine methylase [Oscillospiraceae bacterium]|jgi:DNA adenine methylase|nr:DNA adenine methylase [Oscillospiraceae bacterium]